ncbi:hypothetical protein [Fibrella aquatica]|uniref:hypothetical protein n=1 Tax=Fibrella aquatica TaxID=3242487 RepID=UPI0035228356
MATPNTPAQTKARLRENLLPQPGDLPRKNSAAVVVEGLEEMIDMLSVNTWAPMFGLVADGQRLVLRVIDWTGGIGPKPDTGIYLGSTGYVTLLNEAIDISGTNGWTPVLRGVLTAAPAGTFVEGYVLQVTDWAGGEGVKPATGQYVGMGGLVSTTGQAINIRGSSWHAGNGVPVAQAGGGPGIYGDIYLDYDTGNVYRAQSPSGSSWTLKGNIKGPQGIQGPIGLSAPNIVLTNANVSTAYGIDMSLCDNLFVYITLTGNTTLTLTNVAAGRCVYLRVVQGGAGNFTLTFPASVTFPGSAAVDWHTTAGKVNVFALVAASPTIVDATYYKQ